MLIRAYAKINWNLNVLGELPGGYHELDMLMQSVELCDDVELLEGDQLSLDIAGAQGLSAGNDNLMLRAARLMREHTGVERGVCMRLVKRIPMQAGMGGGSSDAAAVLRGLNEMWGAALGEDELCALGLKLGADVPYCLTGGLCRARGLGERLRREQGAPEVRLIVAMPERGLSTAGVFRRCKSGCEQDAGRALEALRARDWAWLDAHTMNDLQAPACELRPEIAKCIALMRECGADFARMTGSGSAVYGVFETASAERALERVRAAYPVCWLTRTIK